MKKLFLIAVSICSFSSFAEIVDWSCEDLNTNSPFQVLVNYETFGSGNGSLAQVYLTTKSSNNSLITLRKKAANTVGNFDHSFIGSGTSYSTPYVSYSFRLFIDEHTKTANFEWFENSFDIELSDLTCQSDVDVSL